jgi:hypothetical protein
VEVIRDASGELLVQPTNVLNNGFSMSEKVRLPSVPAVGWAHEKNCDCGACQD